MIDTVRPNKVMFYLPLITFLDKDYKAALLLSYLINWHNHFAKFGTLTKDGEFYRYRETICNDLEFSPGVFNRASSKLIDKKVLTKMVRYKGREKKATFYCLNVPLLNDILNDQSVQNAPTKCAETHHSTYKEEQKKKNKGPSKLDHAFNPSGFNFQGEEDPPVALTPPQPSQGATSCTSSPGVSPGKTALDKLGTGGTLHNGVKSPTLKPKTSQEVLEDSSTTASDDSLPGMTTEDLLATYQAKKVNGQNLIRFWRACLTVQYAMKVPMHETAKDKAQLLHVAKVVGFDNVYNILARVVRDWPLFAKLCMDQGYSYSPKRPSIGVVSSMAALLPTWADKGTVDHSDSWDVPSM